MSGLHLTKTERAQIDVIRQVLSPWGLATAVLMGGKHVIVKVWGRTGETYRLVVACTPRSDGHSLQHCRQKATRLLKIINERAGY